AGGGQGGQGCHHQLWPGSQCGDQFPDHRGCPVRDGALAEHPGRAKAGPGAARSALGRDFAAAADPRFPESQDVKRLALVLLLVAAPRAWAQGDAPDKVAADFYAAVPHGGGLPDPAAAARLKPLLSARLAGLLDMAAAAQRRFSARNPKAPPLLEGDLFSSQFEGFTAYRIGSCAIANATARCPVNLTYQPAGDGKPVNWSDAVLLAKSAAGWKVDDIAYL